MILMQVLCTSTIQANYWDIWKLNVDIRYCDVRRERAVFLTANVDRRICCPLVIEGKEVGKKDAGSTFGRSFRNF